MRKLKILIVDDVFTNRLLLTELIGIMGHEFKQAGNGEEAISILEKDDYDLVFMDIEMPVMNGLETTQYIRKKFPYPKSTTKIIALTAYNPDQFFEDFNETGFDELISKPYSLNKIQEIIKSLELR